MKKYWIDFSCWECYADTPEEAEQMVKDYINKNKLRPTICTVEFDEEDERIKEKFVEDCGESVYMK